MPRYKIEVEVEGDDEEQAAQEFLQIISHYLGGIYTERPFDVKRIDSCIRT